MSGESVIGTVVTVAGISAIALTTANGETKTAAIGAIAGLTTPLAQMVTQTSYRGAGHGHGRVEGHEPEFSGGNS